MDSESVGFKTVLSMLDDLLFTLLDGALLTEDRIYQLCQECLQTKLRQPLIRALGEAFTSPSLLARSFPRKVDERHDGEKSMGKFNKSYIC